MQVKDVVFYFIMRLGYHGIKYSVYNAKTGSTYIRVGCDRIRIADHAGTIDNYSMVIRTDCQNPCKIRDKTVVSAENADGIIDLLIHKNKIWKNQDDVLQKIMADKEWTHAQLKMIDPKLLYHIAGLREQTGAHMKKADVMNKLLEEPWRVKRYYSNSD